jgi:hypothetical protein
VGVASNFAKVRVITCKTQLVLVWFGRKRRMNIPSCKRGRRKWRRSSASPEKSLSVATIYPQQPVERILASSITVLISRERGWVRLGTHFGATYSNEWKDWRIKPRARSLQPAGSQPKSNYRWGLTAAAIFLTSKRKCWTLSLARERFVPQ